MPAGGLNSRNAVSQVWRLGVLKQEVGGWLLLRAQRRTKVHSMPTSQLLVESGVSGLVDGVLPASSYDLSFVPIYVQIPPFYEDTSHI